MKTTLYGWTLIAEENTSWALIQLPVDGKSCTMAEDSCKGVLKPVSGDDFGAEGWTETTEEEWLLNFTD